MNRTDAICLLVIILVIVGIISALTYSWYADVSKKGEGKDQNKLYVREGDLITYDYTEYILTGYEEDTPIYSVFKTTINEVAENESIPKSVTFTKILFNQTGSTEETIVGDKLISKMNPGFNKLVIDMKEGQTIKGRKVLAIDGYGKKNESLVHKIPLLDTVSMYETLNRFEFEGQYPQETAMEPGQTFVNHYWDWTIRIESVTDDNITIRHEPEFDMVLDMFDWPVRVVNISSETGLIWLEHKPNISIIDSAIDAEILQYYNPKFTEIIEEISKEHAPYPGIIISTQNGIEINFNPENYDTDLKYDITILTIERE